MNITLSDISSYIIDLIGALGNFLSTGVMFYIVSILILAEVVNIFLRLVRSWDLERRKAYVFNRYDSWQG